ncbi:DEAD/DEAH box helicase family protein [Polycladidibacter stylochi]|uniref:DEAD/DEAH box helicase family protein n=1 Tax=Polycladidibacter stylochi TaxID=1807766 RepID=UPI0008354BBE|nr:DEAD/DEAH box helicase family protein [Pseudovibrio stylochi]
MTFCNLQFKSNWRTYQKRVLDELDGHLDDDHLHIVAAPGSGKTILGLEVMRRLDKPTIILAPSIAIRNQWIDRVTSLFLDEGAAFTDWISNDLRKPKKLTVCTYQALHAALTGAEELEEEFDYNLGEQATATTKKHKVPYIIKHLATLDVQTIILDEAHHLRNEWWKALSHLKEGLHKPTVVSLTATPPYDVDYKEWQKYEKLCGPIDAEISVPELVKQGDLCPHQDYLHFSLPTKYELHKLHQFKQNIADFTYQLQQNQDFIEILKMHPWVSSPQQHLEEILSNPKFFTSVIIFFRAIGYAPPAYVLEILGAKNESIPPLDAKWLEVLLDGVIYSQAKYFTQNQKLIEELAFELKRIGVIDRKQVTISNPKEYKKILANSLGKLESIRSITLEEARELGDELRLVVLSDYIRSEELPKSINDIKPLSKLGVLPIFEHLRRAKIPNIKLGVLTGSVIILPAEAAKVFQRVAFANNIDARYFHFAPLPHDKNFVQLQINGEHKQKIVYLITEVFNQGAISVLVGTQALLGEGWDAPTINSLILASNVGSYMLSNQMRGRAIRIDPQRPKKTANIWHLASLDIENLEEKLSSYARGGDQRQRAFDQFEDIQQDLGEDLRMIQRRFKAFVGVTYDYPLQIESGFKRLGLGQTKWTEAGVWQLNQKTLKSAHARERLHHIWNDALQGSSPKPEMQEYTAANNAPSGFTLYETIKYTLFGALLMGAFVLLQTPRVAAMGVELVWLIMVSLGLIAFYSVPKAYKAIKLLVCNGTLEKSLQQVGWALLETLEHMGHIKTGRHNLRLQAHQNRMGIVYCRLDGATDAERRLFLEAMQEVLGPTGNPRYLLERHSKLWGFNRKDYHPVPAIIGQTKKNAQYFAKKWNRYVGKSNLVYTRTLEGRLALLRARASSFATAFQKKTERMSIWE